MHVAFNAQLLSYRHWYRSAGISRYIDRTLAHVGHSWNGNGFTAFVGPDVPPDVPSLSWLRMARTTLPTHRPLVRILWEQMVLPIDLARLRPDLLHAPAYVAPLNSPCRSVVTFHDLSFFAMPAAFNRQNRLYLQTFSRMSAKNAQRIIAVSEFTRQELGRWLGVDSHRVDVVHNAVDEHFRPEPDGERLRHFRTAKGLPDRFVLCLGTLEPRKNVATLVRAYAQARRRGVTEPLVLAGGRGWGDLDLRALVEQLDLREVVRPVGFVSMDEQPLWYNAASLFAYPSRYEGFGFPALEAMACGTPVIAANRTSLPEVVGDAGILVDPDDVDALAEALVMALRNDDLRHELAVRGRERSQRFSWEAAARATMQTYCKSLGLPG